MTCQVVSSLMIWTWFWISKFSLLTLFSVLFPSRLSLLMLLWLDFNRPHQKTWFVEAMISYWSMPLCWIGDTTTTKMIIKSINLEAYLDYNKCSRGDGSQLFQWEKMGDNKREHRTLGVRGRVHRILETTLGRNSRIKYYVSNHLAEQNQNVISNLFIYKYL